jgi:hypothetical protein
MGYAIDPGTQGAAAIEAPQAYPQGEMNFLQQVAAQLRIGFVSARQTGKRCTELQHELLVLCFASRAPLRQRAAAHLLFCDFGFRSNVHIADSRWEVEILTSIDQTFAKTREQLLEKLLSAIAGAALSGFFASL